jgi:hypothetical protein
VPVVDAEPPNNPPAGSTVRFTVSGVEGTGVAPYSYYYELYQNWNPDTGVPMYGGNMVNLNYVDWTVPSGSGVENWNMRCIVIDSAGSLTEATYDIYIGIV